MSTFHQDLVLIRKDRRLSIQNVFDKCRIPLETIQSIEDGSIFIGKVRNTTYLRSYLRSYGKSVGIADEDMVRALDAVQSGTYDRSLLKRYLPDMPTETPEVESGEADQDGTPASESGGQAGAGLSKGDTSTPDSAESNDTSTPESVGSIETSADGSKPATEKEQPRRNLRITPESQEKSLEDVEWEDSTLKKPLSTSTTGFASAEPPGHRSTAARAADVPDVGNVDWAGKVKSALYRPQRNRLLWVIIAIALALAIALSTGWWLWQRQHEISATQAPATPPVAEVPPETEQPSEPPAVTQQPSDTEGDQPTLAEVPGEPVPTDNQTGSIPEPVLEEVSAAEPSDIEEPADIPAWTTESLHISGSPAAVDTLFVVVYALHGNLEPVRVWSDIFSDDEQEAGPLRPYWVEQGEAMRFRFADHITLQGNLSRMALVFNGHVIEDFDDLYLDGPRIRLTRSWILDQALLNTPQSNPFEQTTPPVAIVDRPRFSP